MRDENPDRSVDEALEAALERGERREFESVAADLPAAPVTERKACAQVLKAAAEEDPEATTAAVPAFEQLLADGERPVRLRTVKAVALLASNRPEDVEPLVGTLTDLLTDEFYFVRGRAAEALGHVAQADPDAIDRPTVLARLLNALSLDRPEVREHVAGALARVAFADPAALRTMTGDCAAHLDDDRDLVRYHLSTAIVVVATEHRSYVASAAPQFRERLDDEVPHVRGRAAEALGLLADAEVGDVGPAADRLAELAEEDASFVAERARWARAVVEGEGTDGRPDGIGDPEAIADRTAEIVEEITAPDGDRECRHCGLALPTEGPPMCPRCGAPC